MGTHSTTPWHVTSGGFIDSETDRVACMFPGCETANAAFIVRAVNSHDRLIAALKTLDECYCEIGAPMTSADRLRHRKAIIETRAALAAAGA